MGVHQLYWPVINDCVRVEALPESPPVTPPHVPVGHHSEVGVLASPACRYSDYCVRSKTSQKETRSSIIGNCFRSDVFAACFSRCWRIISALPRPTMDLPKTRRCKMSPWSTAHELTNTGGVKQVELTILGTQIAVCCPGMLLGQIKEVPDEW